MPKPDQGWTSLTSTNAWGQANDMLSSGQTMQQARPLAPRISGFKGLWLGSSGHTMQQARPRPPSAHHCE